MRDNMCRICVSLQLKKLRAGVNVRRNCMLELSNCAEMESPPMFKTNRVGTGHSLEKSGFIYTADIL